jgi:glutamate carboxypeptidase
VVGLLEELTALESPTGDLVLLARCAARLCELVADLGEVTVLELDGLPHVLVEVGSYRGGPVLLCHYDTVWPAGTYARRPFAVHDGWATGPGVLDMKGGIAIAILALRALVADGLVPATGARLLLTGDEERGNPTSRGLVEQVARGARAALVLEPPLFDGRLKTRRKGIGHAIVEVHGESAHAGVGPESGASAALEAARVALVAAELADPDRGVTVNVGVLAAGERRNVVAARGIVEIDVRAPRAEELECVLEELRTLEPSDARTRLEVTAAMHRPPMEPTAATAELMQIARAVGVELGLDLGEGGSGGGSEANLAHAVGTPTLDGLGAIGRGAHAENECVRTASLTERAALLAGIVAALDDEPAPATR